MMENIQKALNRVARQYGAEIVDVRIKRADLPEGTPLESAYQRMQTARQQEARSIRAQGLKQAQIIRAEPTRKPRTYAEASARIRFYDFYRAMQSTRRPSSIMGPARKWADRASSFAQQRLSQGFRGEGD
jgi:membrane protease subunit HflC